jgi:hypothetical protein
VNTKNVVEALTVMGERVATAAVTVHYPLVAALNYAARMAAKVALPNPRLRTMTMNGP